MSCTFKARLVIKMAVIGSSCLKLSLDFFNLRTDFISDLIRFWLFLPYNVGDKELIPDETSALPPSCSGMLELLLFFAGAILVLFLTRDFFTGIIVGPMVHLGGKLKLGHVIGKSRSFCTWNLTGGGSRPPQGCASGKAIQE